MQNLFLTIKHVIWNFIIMMGFNVFTYNIITSNGVLYCGGGECGEEDCECDCDKDCDSDCKK